MAVAVGARAARYVYSVQRAFYANILRSALVLHTVTLLVFGLVAPGQKLFSAGSFAGYS